VDLVEGGVVIDVRAFREIARPLPEVFEYMADLDKLPLWLDGVKEAKSLEGNPREVGALIAHVNEFMGQTFESRFEVIDWQDNSCMIFRVLSGPLRGESRETFEAIDDETTQVSIEVVGDVVGLFKAGRWIAGRAAQAQLDRSLDNLKDLLERPGED
jgi:uncharacterized membrane protein